MIKGFLVWRGLRRGIQVEVARRWGVWRGRVTAEVDMCIQFKNAYTASLALPGPAPIL